MTSLLAAAAMALVVAQNDPLTDAEQTAYWKAFNASEAAEKAADAAKETAMRKVCGKDYMRVHVGMTLTRALQCLGDLELVAQDERGSVYEATGGHVRIEGGKITRWVAK